jgi:hypothetical protein
VDPVVARLALTHALLCALDASSDVAAEIEAAPYVRVVLSWASEQTPELNPAVVDALREHHVSVEPSAGRIALIFPTAVRSDTVLV